MVGGNVTEWAKLPITASAAAVARAIPRYMRALYGAMPPDLRAGTTSPESMLSYLRDCHVFLTGKEAEINATLWQRMHREAGRVPGRRCARRPAPDGERPDLARRGTVNELVAR